MTTTNQALESSDVGEIFADVVGWVDKLPSLFWQIAFAATVVVLTVALFAGRRAARRLGKYRAQSVSAGQKPDDNNNNKTDQARKAKRDGQLLAATLIPAGLFWLAVLIGSGRGLTAFGRDTLGWHNGWDWLVPGTLDGVAVAFAFLAFRAIWKERNPDRARRIVWASTASSAFINFAHEMTKTDGAVLGALYLGILSIMGMAILDEFLAQFEEGAGYIKREKPRFGLRWITLPYPTLCAWLAWTNYPPVVPTEAGPDGAERSVTVTITMAVEHLDKVRMAKAERRNEADARRSALPAWTRVAPWVRARKLQGMLDRANRSAAAEQSTRDTEHQSALNRLAAEHRSATERLVAEHRAVLEQSIAERAERAEQSTALEHAATEQVEQIRRSATEQEERLEHALAEANAQRGELAVQLERISGELRDARSTAEQSNQLAARAEQVLRSEREKSAHAIRGAEQQSAALLRDAKAATERAEQSARDALARAEQLEQSSAEQIAVLLRDTKAATERAEQSARDALARAEQLEQSSAEQIAALAGQLEQSTRSGAPRSGAPRSGGARKGPAEDREHLVDLFNRLDPPAGGEAWTQRKVNAITQAGFGANGRAQRLITLAMQHSTECDEREHTTDCITLDWVTAATSATATANEN